MTLKRYHIKRQLLALAVVLDLMGQDEFKDAEEVLCRRAVALIEAEARGNWKVAKRMESIMTADQAGSAAPGLLARALKLAKLEKSVELYKDDDSDDDPSSSTKGGGRR